MKVTEASEALQRIGLSRYEALVFVNLARAGATTAGDVARASGVNRVQTYRALDGLEARGLVEVTLDRPRRYAARAINELLDMIAKGEVHAFTTTKGLQRSYRAGINEALLSAMRRGVKARLAADVNETNAVLMARVAKYVPLRHVDRQRARFIIVDRESILAFLIQ